MDDTTTAIAAALDRVGPRLKQLRARRGVTLTAPSEATGISKSTLSRLETGQRRASLELLLPLAQAYRVPLDDLVGAPEVGDPRIRLKATNVNGRTVVPLTRSPGGVQAWRIIVPASNSEPAPKSHEGYAGAEDEVVVAEDQTHPAGEDELVRKHRRPASGDPEHVWAAGRARARPSKDCRQESLRGMRMA